MPKEILKKCSRLTIALLIVAIFAPLATYAQSSQGQQQSESQQGRLEQNQLKICQKHQKTIQNIMSKAGDRGKKQLAVFNKISQRVQAFYENKDRQLDSYNTLLENVNAKKTLAENSVEAAYNYSDDFACDADNPKGIAYAFKDKFKAQNSALKEYRTAIKDLIVGVKSVQSDTEPTSVEGQ